jgi:hypothetical protein
MVKPTRFQKLTKKVQLLQSVTKHPTKLQIKGAKKKVLRKKHVKSRRSSRRNLVFRPQSNKSRKRKL